METYNKEQRLKSVICHEWGHFLVLYILNVPYYGMKINAYIERCKGCGGSMTHHYFKSTNENHILLCMGGVCAEYLCGYKRDFVLEVFQPDTQEIYDITQNEAYIEKCKRKIVKMFKPYKDVLNYLTDLTYRYNLREETEEYVWYYVYPDELCAYLKEAIEETKCKKPYKKVTCDYLDFFFTQ